MGSLQIYSVTGHYSVSGKNGLLCGFLARAKGYGAVATFYNVTEDYDVTMKCLFSKDKMTLGFIDTFKEDETPSIVSFLNKKEGRKTSLEGIYSGWEIALPTPYVEQVFFIDPFNPDKSMEYLEAGIEQSYASMLSLKIKRVNGKKFIPEYY